MVEFEQVDPLEGTREGAWFVSNRDEMLGFIRNILKTKEKNSHEAGPRTLPPPLEGVMPEILPEELAERFESELESLGCNSYRASTLRDLEEKLCTILAQVQAKSVVLSRNPILNQLQIAKMLEDHGQRVVRWPESAAEQPESSLFSDECFGAGVGITGVDFALAETGSLVLTSLTEGSQLTSLAPPVHIALYRRSQIRASLDEVLQNLPVSRDPARPSPARSLVFVSGTSRTADIEQILVRGVHGPRSVHAILVEDSCLAE
jgi:L-lactate dehydrogenase complex protein LldG